MDWQASIEDRSIVITFRGLTVQRTPNDPLCEAFRWIKPGQTWGGRSFEEWLAFLQKRGGSVMVGFDGSGGLVLR